MNDEIRKAFEGAEDIQPAEGLDVPDRGGPPPRTPDEIPPEAIGAKFPLNDTGNGKRFALYFGEDVVPVPRVGWFVWDGKRWRKDPDSIAARGRAQLVQDRVIAEIPHLVLEPWQLKEIEAEPMARARQALLLAIEAEERTAEQQIELEDLSQKLVWIRKLKDRKSTMKSDHRSFAKTTGNKGRIDSLLIEATVSLARDVEELDTDPLTVNTESGILRFSAIGGADEDFSRTARVDLEPHTRESTVSGQNLPQLITKMMPVEYDPSAKCPQFDAFLERIQPDRDMRQFLQRWFGLSMTGLTGEQKFAFLYGAGANGKSVLMDLLARMMGDYAATAKIESLTGRNRRGGGDATPDLVPLVGARIVRASEPEEGERLQEGTIKELTGGEPIMVRSLHADFVEVKPIFKLTMSGNHKPDIRGTDDGIWRRVLLVPFDVQIPKADRDDKMSDKLWTERSGILNWLVDGLVDYLEGGLREPAAVLEATNEYRSDSDPIGSFLRECCIVTGQPGDHLSSRELIDGFNLWLDQKGEPMWERKASLAFRSAAGRYRDPATGRKYEKGKHRVTGYNGIKFLDFFAREYDGAPRNAKGRPVAASSRSGSPDEVIT